MKLLISTFITTALLSLLLAPALAAELIVVEQDDCPYCKRFNHEIAEAYPKTAEGKLAPLRRVDLQEDWPADLANVPIERFTPTFILVENGQEVDRLIGYPGDEYFWFLLGEMLDKLPTKQ